MNYRDFHTFTALHVSTLDSGTQSFLSIANSNHYEIIAVLNGTENGWAHRTGREGALCEARGISTTSLLVTESGFWLYHQRCKSYFHLKYMDMFLTKLPYALYTSLQECEVGVDILNYSTSFKIVRETNDSQG